MRIAEREQGAAGGTPRKDQQLEMEQVSDEEYT
jgi:hypothetical protein